MPVPHFDTVRDTPLPTDAELVPHLQAMLEQSLRRQIWIMLLDRESKPLPLVMPSDVDEEPDPEDVIGYADMLRCLSWDFDNATLVLTFERPGPAELTDQDRRWLRLLRQACAESDCSFRGPYLLLGGTVRAVAAEEYAGIPWVYSDGDDDPEYDD
jgi:hypothetical protein